MFVCAARMWPQKTWQCLPCCRNAKKYYTKDGKRGVSDHQSPLPQTPKTRQNRGAPATKTKKNMGKSKKSKGKVTKKR